MLLFPCVSILAVGTVSWFQRPAAADSRLQLPNLLPIPNSSGFLATFSESAINLDNAFFQSLGANGRSCGSCHQPSDGWSVSAQNIRLRFYATQGKDPIFRTNDGSDCNTSDVSTFAARRQSYSLLLNKGLIRIELPVPLGAEFVVSSALNPYGCTSTASLSMYRRPLPSANLRFLSTVMWDGRESHPGNTLQQNLLQQALDATTGHAQGTGLSAANQQAIVDFEMALFTAQLADFRAGRLDSDGANGGPKNLSQQNFYIGINDPLGLNPTGAAFNPKAMTLFDAWTNAHDDEGVARRSIARGQALFNTKPISIIGVGGLNDNLGVAVIPGTCTTCHDSPNVGNHSVSAPLNVGVVDPALAVNHDLPVFTLVNLTTHATVTTTDPGRAMVSGLWKDIGKTKGPILRGLASRAPYFHNGSAATLLDAVNFYDTRFAIGFTAQEKADLVNFLSTL
jgi:cytochrome c peroxidase